jgi:hypothetical protein
MSINVWTVIGPSMMNAYNTRKAAEEADPPEDYNGPMDDESWAILNGMFDVSVVQPMYETKTVNGQNPFTLFTMNFLTAQEATDSMDYLDATWPGQQIEIEGAWDETTGLQLGLTYTYDNQDPPEIDGIAGTPVYPIPVDAYTLMPPVIVYDENGDVVSSTPATSNADLRDINLVYGQTPRIFTDTL